VIFGQKSWRAPDAAFFRSEDRSHQSLNLESTSLETHRRFLRFRCTSRSFKLASRCIGNIAIGIRLIATGGAELWFSRRFYVITQERPVGAEQHIESFHLLANRGSPGHIKTSALLGATGGQHKQNVYISKPRWLRYLSLIHSSQK
jgi:hypothetical protein